VIFFPFVPGVGVVIFGDMSTGRKTAMLPVLSSFVQPQPRNPMPPKSTGLRFFLVLAVAIVSGSLSTAFAQVHVACVGDSITAGYGLADPGRYSYPAQLQSVLGSGFVVGNFGRSGATALKRSDNTYWNSSQYRASLKSAPDFVIIMLGTNDSKSWNWNATKFNTDYRALIAQYQGLSSAPRVYICLIPPVYVPNAFGTTFDPAFIQNVIVPAIRNIATQTGVTLIDNNTPLQNHPEYFSDGVHPTEQGANIIANTVYNALLAP
jgi:lysophospholipase L1-like esterase